MPLYFEYLFKASFCLAITFLFYILFLRRMTHFVWNRFFLLIFSVVSFIIPLIQSGIFLSQTANVLFISKINFLGKNAVVSNSLNEAIKLNYAVLLSAYLIVVFVLSARFLLQLLSLKKIQSSATLIENGNVKIFHLSKNILPFSFGNSIFINSNNYEKNELREIITHEKVHAKQRHTIDVAVAEIICIINWFNPFAWLTKKAIRENCEFIADNVVINKSNNINIKSYQYLLLKATGNLPLPIANSLKFASIKDRVIMMNKTKTGRFYLLKFVLFIPVIAVLLLAFGEKQEKYTEKTSITTTYILSSLTYFIPDKKIAEAVTKEKKNCLLKTGENLNLYLVYQERIRLNALLEKNGFNDIGKPAITFMIDTTLGNNSFSIQININLAKNEFSQNSENNEITNNKIKSPADQFTTNKIKNKGEVSTDRSVNDSRFSAANKNVFK